MIYQIHPRIQLGDAAECRAGNEHTAVVHTADWPCRMLMHSQPTSEYDLLILTPGDLLNPAARAWVEQAWVAGRCILIHCTHAISRSPSIATVAMAKWLHLIPAQSAATAATAITEMQRLHPAYQPSPDWQAWMESLWDTIA